jgi:hypothetical protein
LRYEVTVKAANGQLVCGATLQCPDGAAALRRFEELPLPPGQAELRRGSRVLARRSAAAPSVLGRLAS